MYSWSNQGSCMFNRQQYARIREVASASLICALFLATTFVIHRCARALLKIHTNINIMVTVKIYSLDAQLFNADYWRQQHGICHTHTLGDMLLFKKCRLSEDHVFKFQIDKLCNNLRYNFQRIGMNI